MEPFKVGDVVWFANCNTRPVEHPCPVCFGKLKVTVILGDGSRVETPCQNCGLGFNGPRGFVQEYEYVAKPEQVTITRIEQEITAKGVKQSLFGSNRILDDLAFRTETEALAKCEEIAAQHRLEQETRACFIKKNQNKSYSWNAGYHMRTAEDYREKVAYHERMAVICKERSKTKEAEHD